MTGQPTQQPPFDRSQYVWAIVLLVGLGSSLVIGILYLRPAIDPLIVLGSVMGVLTPTLAGVLAFIKAQETHLSVNSRLDAWIHAQEKLARAEGVIEGANQSTATRRER